MDFSGLMLLIYVTWFGMLAAVGVPLPVSVPPLPEDPVLVRMAPADCLAFCSWSGAAEPDPKSPNRTERLCAEPEVRQLIAQLRAALAGLIADEARDEAGGLPVQLFQVAIAALQRPGCGYVRNLQYEPRPRLEAGFALKLGDDRTHAKAVMGAVELLFAARLGSSERHEDIAVDGVTFHALPVDTEHPFLGWAEVDDWFLIAIGTETPSQLVGGLRGTSRGLHDNKNYEKLMPACAVARPATRAFVDLTKLYALLGHSNERLLALLAAVGLRQATAACSCAGFEGDGFATRLCVATPERSGWLGALAGPPLGQDDLAQIPLDADIALSARIDPAAAEQALLATAAALGGENTRAEYEREVVAEFESTFGIKWRQDLLGTLGDQLTIWNAPSQGGALFTGAVASIGIRDRERFGATLAKLTDWLRQQLPSKAAARAAGQRRLSGNGLYLEAFEHAGKPVSWLDNFDDDFPFATTWTATDHHLLVGLSPQAVRCTLDAGEPPNPDRSLVRLPFLNKRGKATAMFYWHAQAVFSECYAPLLVLLQAGGNEWQREGFDFDLADVPRPQALLPHLDRELVLLEPNANGWLLARNGSLPVFDPLTQVLAIGFAVLCSEL